MSETRRPRSPKTGGSDRPSKASLGVVTVDDDFTTEYPDGDRLSAEVFATLFRTGEALSDEVDRCMVGTFGVSQPVLNTLAVIDGSPEPLMPTQIGERVVKSSATITGTLDALERLGWIHRLPNPDDRRSLLIEPTDEGRAVADQFLPGVRTIEQAMLAELTAAQRATLLKLLAKVLRGTARLAAEPPTRLEGRRVRPERLRRGFWRNQAR